MRIFQKIKDAFSFKLDDPIIETDTLLSGPVFPPKRDEGKIKTGHVYCYEDDDKAVLTDIIVNGESVKRSLAAREIFIKDYAKAEREAVCDYYVGAIQHNQAIPCCCLRALYNKVERKKAEATRKILKLVQADRARTRG